MAYLIIFILGLSVGSFLNAVIWRIKEGKSFLKGRSLCPNCGRLLSWQDLIPVFSFLILAGKCRWCKEKISWQYPLVELGTAFLFGLAFYFFLPTLALENILTTLYYLVIFCLFIIIFVYDLKNFIIPDKVIFPAIIIVFVYNVWELGFDCSLVTCSEVCRTTCSEVCRTTCSEPTELLGFGIFRPLLNPIISAAVASLFFLSIIILSKGRWMGFGDVKLVFLLGLFLGFPKILVALFLSFFIGAIIGLGLIFARKRSFKSEVPFGPFLITGALIALFWAEGLLNWYWNITYGGLFFPF